MTKSQGWLKVAMPGAQATIRERRSDATECAYCHTEGRTFYDYVDTDPEKWNSSKAPAFCNRDHYMQFVKQIRLADPLSAEETVVEAGQRISGVKSQVTFKLKHAKPPAGKRHLATVS